MIHNNAMLNSHPQATITQCLKARCFLTIILIQPTYAGGGLIQGLTDQVVLAIGAHHDAENNRKQLAPILGAQGRDHFMHNFKQDLMAHFAHMHWLRKTSLVK